jgi:hypothetical protein
LHRFREDVAELLQGEQFADTPVQLDRQLVGSRLGLPYLGAGTEDGNQQHDSS